MGTTRGFWWGYWVFAFKKQWVLEPIPMEYSIGVGYWVLGTHRYTTLIMVTVKWHHSLPNCYEASLFTTMNDRKLTDGLDLWRLSIKLVPVLTFTPLCSSCRHLQVLGHASHSFIPGILGGYGVTTPDRNWRRGRVVVVDVASLIVFFHHYCFTVVSLMGLILCWTCLSCSLSDIGSDKTVYGHNL